MSPRVIICCKNIVNEMVPKGTLEQDAGEFLLGCDCLTFYIKIDAYGEAISIEEHLGGDTKVLLVMRNRVNCEEGAQGLEPFKGHGEEYDAYVEALKRLMD